MSQIGYDASQVGVPFKRVYGLGINYFDGGLNPAVDIVRRKAIKMADGAIASIGELEPIRAHEVRMDTDGDTLIPMRDPDTGLALTAEQAQALGLPQYTTWKTIYMHLVAGTRQIQDAEDSQAG